MLTQHCSPTSSSIPCQPLLHVIFDVLFTPRFLVLLYLEEKLVESVDQEDIDSFDFKQLFKLAFDCLHHAPRWRGHQHFVHQFEYSRLLVLRDLILPLEIGQVKSIYQAVLKKLVHTGLGVEGERSGDACGARWGRCRFRLELVDEDEHFGGVRVGCSLQRDKHHVEYLLDLNVGLQWLQDWPIMPEVVIDLSTLPE